MDMLPPDDSSVRLSLADRLRGIAGFVTALFFIHCVPLWVVQAILRRSQRVMRPARREETERLITAVRWASRAYFGRAACLEVSLGACCASAWTWRMPVWCVGTSFRPVAQHGWVEVDGVPVSEPEVNEWPYFKFMAS